MNKREASEFIKSEISIIKNDITNINNSIDLYKIQIEKLMNITNSGDEDEEIFSPRNDAKLKRLHAEEEINEYELKRANAYKQLAYKQNQLESYETIIKINNNKQIINLNEYDRKRIARELHDTTIQNLVCLMHKVELASNYLDMDPIRTKLELSTINKYLKEEIEQIRSLVYDLRPMSFDDLGFDTLLDRYFEELDSNYNMKVHFDSNVDFDGYEKEFLISIYRIIKECCINSVKHSGVNDIYIKISEDDSDLYISIEDHGKGFDFSKKVDERHYGMLIMKDRIDLLMGKVNFVSNTGEGYRTEISFQKNR